MIDIQYAKKHLDLLVDRAASGEDIVIARAGKPIACLIEVVQPAEIGSRQPGMFPGLKVPRSFFDPLPDTESSGWA